MSYYDEVYTNRINRYGYDYQERMQSKREENFERYLLKSVYRVTFEWNEDEITGTLEPYSQNDTKTLAYLLTRCRDNIPAGTVLMIPDKDGEEKPWMVYYLENLKASGYNRYIMIKMSHIITWKGRDGETYSTWSYFYGQEDNMLKDELKSRSRSQTLYTENLKLSFFITPVNKNINKDDYFTVTVADIKQGYRVTGFDVISTEGVEYVSVDPVYLFDETEAPTKTAEDNSDDFFWLTGEE